MKDPGRLETEALRRYFKRCKKLSTFERHLYRFGFRKLARSEKVEHGGDQPHVFYNNTLKGKNAKAILKLQTSPGFGRGRGTAAQTPTPTAEQPLSKHRDSHPDDMLSSNNSPSTFLNEKVDGQNLGSAHIPRLGTSTGGGGQTTGASQFLSRKKRCTGSKMAGSGRADQGDSGGSEGEGLGVGNDPVKPGLIEPRGGHEANVRLLSGRTFCGWQRPLRNKSRSGKSDSSGGLEVVSQGEVAMGPIPVSTKDIENNHTRDADGRGITALTMSEYDGRDDSDSGGSNTSSVSTTTLLPQKREISFEQDYATEDVAGHAESFSSAIDLDSMMPPQECPVLTMAGSQELGNHLDALSVKLAFAGNVSFPLSPIGAPSDVDIDAAFRRALHSGDTEFAGMDVGDSILGECVVTEGPSVTVESHDWIVREGCDSYEGGGAYEMATRGGLTDQGSTGPSSTSFDGSAMLCGEDVPKTSGRGFGGVLSPNQLPSIPSPLSLDHPPYHSMQDFMRF